MTRYECEIVETRLVRVYYEIEAESLEDAKRKALAGETIAEQELPLTQEITERELFSEPRRITTGE